MRQTMGLLMAATLTTLASAAGAQPADAKPEPEASDRQHETAQPSDTPPAPAAEPAQPPPASAPQPSAGEQPARVESTAGVRWSPSLGFVGAGSLPPSDPGQGAELSVVEPPPGAAGPGVRDTGRAPSDGAASSDGPRESIGVLSFGLGTLGLEPDQPAPSSPGQRTLLIEKSSALELSTGVRWIFAGGERIGGTIGLGLSMQFADLEVTDENGQKNKYSVFGAPLWARGGLDVHVVRFLDVGPRLGAQVGPYSLTPEDDGTTGSSSSSSGSPGQSEFSFLYEYGAAVRLSFGKFAFEPALIWRKGSDVSGQYLTANAMFGLGSLYLLGWWESRLSTSGDNTGTTAAEAFARGMPEASRLGVGVGLSIL